VETHLGELARFGKSMFSVESAAVEIEQIESEPPLTDTASPIEGADPLQERFFAEPFP